MKVVFYSGCQVNSLVECSSGPILMPELAAQDVTYCCVRDVEPEVLEGHVKEADLIIATPTRPDFEGDSRLSSQHLVNTKRQSATLVLAPNWDCPFYFPDDSHLYVGSELITEPCGGHFLGLFDSYMKGEGFDYFLEHCVNNPDYIPNVDKYFRDSQDGNRRRTKRAHEYIEGQKNCCVIALDDFIEETHKDQLLSYTHNHPTAHLIRHFAESLCKIRDSRAVFSSRLHSRNWFTYPSQTNFVFTEPVDSAGKKGPEVASSLYEFLKTQKILVRYFPNHSLTESFLRVTIGTDSEMETLNRAIDQWTANE